MDKDNETRERAYRIWLNEGSPDGRDEGHWSQAEKEIRDEKAKQGDSPVATKKEAPKAPPVAAKKNG